MFRISRSIDHDMTFLPFPVAQVWGFVQKKRGLVQLQWRQNLRPKKPNKLVLCRVKGLLFFVSQPGGFPIGVAEGACLDCLPGRWPSHAKGRVAGAATAGRGGTALVFFCWVQVEHMIETMAYIT